MKTYLECIPCFLKQAIEASRIAGADVFMQKTILDKLCGIIPEFSIDASPPVMGQMIHSLVKEVTGKDDPYKDIKKKSNKFALEIYPKLKEIVNKSDDRLLSAIRIAIAGNVIDYAVGVSINIEKEIDECLKRDFDIFDYIKLKKMLKKTDRVLYLADNAGEVVFDRVLLEELRELKKEVIYAVRGKPIINDALIEDAVFCGIDKLAVIMTNGSDFPGTVLKNCSNDFLKTYSEAKLIISKGVGNFETLSDEKRPIFFLFKVKCPVVARNINCTIGNFVLKNQS